MLEKNSRTPLNSTNFGECIGLGRLTFLIIICVSGCSKPPAPAPVPAPPPAVPVANEFNFVPSSKSHTSDPRPADNALGIPFVDVAQEFGLVHQYNNGAEGQLLMVEAMGGGWAALDYDGDHFTDSFLTQGGAHQPKTSADRPPDQLFRNIDGHKFTPVAELSGADDRGYGQGAAAADFDNDGFPDLYITNHGRNVLLHNLGDGTFENMTEMASVSDGRWSTSAAWCDLDLDGDVDLYVCNYLQYDPLHPLPCRKDDRPALCHPRNLAHWPDEYYENLGDGRFAAKAQEIGLAGPDNKGLGVAVADFDNDGRPDVFVCNDTTPNFLFLNDGTGKFSDSAARYGAARNSEGNTQANMGVAVGDVDHDGRLDLYVTHFTFEWSTLYKNLWPLGFQDVSLPTGLVTLTRRKLGFGAVMADFDGDGNIEIFSANGHIDPHSTDGEGYEMTPQLVSRSGAVFADISNKSGGYFGRKVVGRGVSLTDFDNDGDWDLGIAHQNSPAALLRNDSSAISTVKIRLVGVAANRTGLHARVTLKRDGAEVVQELVGGTSYCSSHEPCLIFRSQSDLEASIVEIRWPGGVTQNIKLKRGHQSIIAVENQLPAKL